MARELGADERMVAVLQYLRVLLIVVLMPVVATGGLRRVAVRRTGGRRRRARLAGRRCCSPSAAAVVGLLVGRLVAAARRRAARPDAGWPRPSTSAASATAPRCPALVSVAAFLVIGLQVGVSFTRDSLRHDRPGAAAGAGRDPRR